MTAVGAPASSGTPGSEVSLSGLARAITARRAANLAGAGELTRRQQIHHIVRRLAFGATPAQLQHFRSIGAQATIQELLNYQNTPNDGVSDGSELELPFEPGPAAELRAWWVARMVDTAQPFEERMVLYWHGLLTSDIIKVGLPLLLKQQNDFFRANALAGWETLLKGIYKDPAMLRYLDNGQNQVGAPNENYAREQLELFTLGLGNYTEEDVRESARALTGWVIDRRDGQASFIPRRHDDGIKDFLGQSGRFNADDVVEIILQQPAAAHFITRRTMEHFVAPEPDGAYVERVKERFSADGMTIRTLMEAIFTDPDFLAPPNYWSTIKSPVEFVVGIARTFALPGELRGLAEAAALMGQALFVPPNVAGWPGGTSWISSGSWFYRLNFVNFVIDQIIASEVGRAMWADVDSAEGFVDLLIDTLLAGDVQAQQRDLIVQYASAPGAGKQLGPLSEERLRGALYLTLALPEYQLL